jgi:Uma2 family endonuclease
MSPTTAAPRVTTEELLAMPQDGVERWLIRGELREKLSAVRDRGHARVTARLAQLLGAWLDSQPAPRGELLGGDVGVRLQRDPDTTVAIDMVYFSPDVARDSRDMPVVDGLPTLAIEILAPEDTEGEINEKIDTYLVAGVPLVWIVNPHRRTVLVYRPGAEPQLFNASQDLADDPHLPGFRVPGAQIFSR